MDRRYHVYVLTNRRNGTLYLGITNDLERRTLEHKNGLLAGFTKKYGLHRLVYYETHGNPYDAISREKQLKEWRRQWKLDLIEKDNPTRRDLSEGWFD